MSMKYDRNTHRREYILVLNEFNQRGERMRRRSHKRESLQCQRRDETLITQISEDSKNDVAYTTAENKKISNQQVKSENQPQVESENQDVDQQQVESDNQPAEVGQFLRDSLFSRTLRLKRRSLASNMSRLMSKFNRSVRRRNASSACASANRNTIHEDEVLTLKGDQCVSRKGTSEYVEPQHITRKIEELHQQSSGQFLDITPNFKTKLSSSGLSTSKNSGSLKRYDSSLPDDVEVPNKANGFVKYFVSNQLYERSVNKHGDVVEYAVPYSEADEIPPPAKNESELRSIGNCEDIIDKNFEFLNDSNWGCLNGNLNGLEAIQTCIQNNPMTVTDLNKSLDGIRSDQYEKQSRERHKQEILAELDSLRKWSENMRERGLPKSKIMSPGEKSDIMQCRLKEITHEVSALRSTISSTLDFSSGTFRKTPVTLRKCRPRDLESLRLVEVAIERDYEILCQVRHSNVVLLMAACFTNRLVNHMTLILEPVDYTLNFFLHIMDESLSLLDSVSVVLQIANASLYLQECGFIHSNISSHNILVRRYPLCVKLSSFELATEIDCFKIKAEIESKYDIMNKQKSDLTNCMDLTESLPIEKNSMSLKELYKQMSKRSPVLRCSLNTEHAYLSMPPKYLMYNTNYRLHLSVHNFQAPELLTTEAQFVFPTAKTDVYSLCLLIWEILNKCVPFAVYNRLDVEQMVSKNKLKLPFFEQERCQLFLSIFSMGLALKPQDRAMDIQELILMLEEIRLEINSSVEDDESRYYDRKHGVNRNYVGPQNMNESTSTDVFMSSQSFAKNVTPRKPQHKQRSNDDSMLKKSLLEFNRSLSIAERTSTIKKPKQHKRKYRRKTIRELFQSQDKNSDVVDMSQLSSSELNENRDAIADDILCSRESTSHEFSEDVQNEDNVDLNKVIGPIIVKERELPTKMTIHKNMENIADRESQQDTTPEVVAYKFKNSLNNSNSVDKSQDASVPQASNRRKLNLSEIAPAPSKYRFTVGDCSLPETSIARKNKMLRNAWLSNEILATSENEIDDKIIGDSSHYSFNLGERKALNVSFKIIHSNVTPKNDKHTATESNGNIPTVMSRIKFFDDAKQTSEIDVPRLHDKQLIPPNKKIPSKNHTLTDGSFSNASTSPITQKIDKETVLEDIMDSIANSKILSNQQLPEGTDLFKNKLWKREMEICNKSLCSNDGEEGCNAETTKRRSVRDTILEFEKRAEAKTSTSVNPSKATSGVGENHFKFGGTPTLIKRTIYRESIVSGMDLKLLDQQMPFFDEMNLTAQKLTSCVTLNMRQVHRRSSDVGFNTDRYTTAKEQRNTICGSEEGLVSFDAGALSNSLGGDRSPSAITKYVCSNCVSRMSTDELKSLKNTSRSLTDDTGTALTSPEEDNPSQRRCQALVNTQISQNCRSIEDLYIDDDFLHGLDANMELQSDSSDFLNFDLISSEFFNSKKNC